MGDTFTDDTVSQYLMRIPEDETYIHANYDVKTFTTNAFRANYESSAGRIRNALAAALIEYVTPLPKMVVIICEDDVIKDLAATSELEARCKYERIIGWLFNEVRKLLAGHNDSLPLKAKRNVHVIWVVPTEHIGFDNNAQRVLFAKFIGQTAKIHDRNYALDLRELWDGTDSSLYVPSNHRFSTAGLSLYWRAVDRAIKFGDTLISRSIQKWNRTFLPYSGPNAVAPRPRMSKNKQGYLRRKQTQANRRKENIPAALGRAPDH